ncbi:hypothetical protein D3C76_1307050 [compost metagenome]
MTDQCQSKIISARPHPRQYKIRKRQHLPINHNTLAIISGYNQFELFRSEHPYIDPLLLRFINKPLNLKHLRLDLIH